MPAPTGVVSQACNNGQYGFPTVIVAWTPTQNPHNIYRAGDGFTRQLVGQTAGGVGFIRFDGLKSGTSYDFDVTEVVSSVESSPSTVTTVVTEDAAPYYPNVSVSSTSSTQSTITINFLGGDSTELVLVYRSSDGGLTFQPWSFMFYQAFLYDDCLTPSTTYIYRYAGDGAEVEEISVSTTARPGSTPAEPVGLTVIPDIDGIHLNWTNPDSAVVEIERSYFYPISWSNVGTTSAGATSFIDTTFLPRQGAYYRIRTKSGSNYSDYITPFQKLISTPSTYRGGITVQVGPGKANATLTDALLDDLGPGDTLEYYWDGTTVIPWKILLSGSGTPNAPITFKGIRNGSDRPKINGDGATEIGGSSASQEYYVVGVTPKSSDAGGYKPTNWIIEGFEIYNARPEHSYIPYGGGSALPYNTIASAIFVKTALDVTIKDCYLHDAPNVVRQGTGREDRYYSGCVQVIDCTIDQWGFDSDPGGPGSDADRKHGLYLDGIDTVVKNCLFISCYPGTSGIAAKLRCPNALVQGNYFQNNTKFVDIINCGGYQVNHILRHPNYHRSRVLGNMVIIDETYQSYRASLFGFDDNYYASIKGPHYVAGNTFVSITGASTPFIPNLRIFRTDNGGTYVLDVGIIEWGNAFISMTNGGTPRIFTIEGEGPIQHGVSWHSATPIDSGVGITIGRDKMLTGGPTNGGLIDIAGDDFRPSVSSILVDAYVEGPVDITLPDYEPLGGVRTQTGSARDLGAYESSPPATGYSLTGPTHGNVGVASSNFTVALTPSGGTASSTTITPHSTTTGTFSPTTVSLSTGSPSATFTFTPTNTNGSPSTISVTNSGSLTNPSSIVYTITTVITGSLTVIEASGQTFSSIIIKNQSSTNYFQIFASGSVGQGNLGSPDASTDIPAWFEQVHEDATANSHGIAVTSSRVTTVNPSVVTQTTGLLLQTSRSSISASVVDTGRITGVSAYAWRNEPDDAGSSDWSEALEFVYGHGNLPDNTIHTNYVFGIRLVPAVNTGTVDNLYDVFITSVQTGGTIGTHYPIYQEQTGLTNYFGSTINTNSMKLRTGAAVGSYLACNNVNGSSVWSGLKPVHIADSSAEDGTIYFSTTQNKLVYKIGISVPPPLY